MNSTAAAILNSTAAANLNSTAILNSTAAAILNSTAVAILNFTAILNSTAAANLNSTAAAILNSTAAATLDCGLPPAVSAATSVVVREVVTYTCNSGYVLHGRPDNVTCFSGQWTGDTPTCTIQKKSIDIHNKPQIFNQIQAMPPWLMIILAAVLGCAVLLLLCCMVALCLKCLGCTASAKRLEEDTTENARVCCARNRPIVDNRPRQEDMLQPENDIAPANFLTLTQHSAVTRKEVTTSLPPTYAGIYKKRRKAKQVKKWMPHSNDVRPYNSSTR